MAYTTINKSTDYFRTKLYAGNASNRSITFDESFFEGTSAYALGTVLERFFRKYVSLNSFTETVLITQQRGEIARWQPMKGLARTI